MSPAQPLAPRATPAGGKLLTAADLAALPRRLPSGDVRYELDDGKLIVIPPPGDVHGRHQAKIVAHLMAGAEDRGLGEVRGEVGVVLRRNPDRVVGPGAVFVLARSLPVARSPEGYLETIPEIVVEIRSKNDTDARVAGKTQEYLAAGVVVVWVLDPDAGTVTECRAGRPPRVFAAADTLACDLLPGFSVPVARLFAGP